jgi:NADPH:quinone reductase-like Zn-dependent oxidoreductase
VGDKFGHTFNYVELVAGGRAIDESGEPLPAGVLEAVKACDALLLGAVGAGEVESVGAGVADVTPGTRALLAPGVSCGHCRECLAGRDNFCRHYGILGESRTGGYAELISVPRANLLPFPEALSFVEAAALPLTFQTAWQMLVDRAGLRPGELVLVLAAASGVGSAAVQIAKLFGATVIATASSEAKLEAARALGADHLINHSSQDLLQEVRRISGRRGVDVVFEHVGMATWEKSILCCARGGRIVTCGATSGYQASTDLRHVFFRQLSILGSTMGSKSVLHTIIDHVRAGRLRPVLDRVLPLEQAAEAHRRLEARAAIGKLVLEV